MKLLLIVLFLTAVLADNPALRLKVTNNFLQGLKKVSIFCFYIFKESHSTESKSKKLPLRENEIRIRFLTGE